MFNKRLTFTLNCTNICRCDEPKCEKSARWYVKREISIIKYKHQNWDVWRKTRCDCSCFTRYYVGWLHVWITLVLFCLCFALILASSVPVRWWIHLQNEVEQMHNKSSFLHTQCTVLAKADSSKADTIKWALIFCPFHSFSFTSFYF